MRGSAALTPFVDAWKLPLNPEDLDEMAYAVLAHALSIENPDRIIAAVQEQIAEAMRSHERMMQAVRDQTERKQNRDEGNT